MVRTRLVLQRQSRIIFITSCIYLVSQIIYESIVGKMANLLLSCQCVHNAFFNAYHPTTSYIHIFSVVKYNAIILAYCSYGWLGSHYEAFQSMVIYPANLLKFITSSHDL